MANFSEDQIAEFRGAFDFFDKNKDGVITIDELSIVMRSLGKTASEDDLRKIIKDVVPAGGESLDFADFLELMGKHYAVADSEQYLREAFTIFDKDGNGYISWPELHHLLSNLGEKITPSEAEDMIKEVDTDGDGMINFDEFCKILKIT